MASGLNKVTLIGNLGKDPEMRYTQSGTAVCNFSLAVTERRKDGDSWGDQTEWFNIVSFGKTAENIAKFLKKGRQTFIDGRLQTRKWQDKNGNDRYTTEVIANQVLFLGNKESAESGGYKGQSAGFEGSSSSSNGSNNYFSPSNEAEEEDIPF